MRLTICAAAVALIAASTTPALAKHSRTAFQLNSTTWVFTDHGTRVRESIDANGNYIVNSLAGKHIDHGTAVMKGNKACFTSAMNNDGELCWTTSAVRIGHAMRTTSDKGEKKAVTRTKYRALEMPK
jgi:hypothetical protein